MGCLICMSSVQKSSCSTKLESTYFQPILDHPEICGTMTEEDRWREQGPIDSKTTNLVSLPSSQETTFPLLVQLNFLSGRAGSMIKDIIQYADWNAIHQRIIENQRSRQEATINLEGKKKLTTGTLFKTGKSILDHDVHDLVAENREEKEKMEQSVCKWKAEEWKKMRWYYCCLRAQVQITMMYRLVQIIWTKI